MSTKDSAHPRIGIREAFGLDPLSERLRDMKLTLFGDGSLPRSRFDLTSLRVFQPWLDIPLGPEFCGITIPTRQRIRGRS